MKIAAYLDARSQPISLYEAGTVHVFEERGDNESHHWDTCSRHTFNLGERTSLAHAKSAVATLVEGLPPECRVLLSSEIQGLPYSVLQEEYGFRTWKSEGPLAQQLDFVRDREREQQARKKFELVLLNNQPVPAPMLTQGGAAGHFWIDLRAALEHPSNPTSRAVLIPFLAAGQFVRLDILCSHLPKWMAWELERLDLAAQTEDIDATDPGIRVIVHSRLTPEGRALRPGLLGYNSAAASEPCSCSRSALPAPGAQVIDITSRLMQQPDTWNA